ncbi:SDR family oxidoreductase [Massilia sp. 9096]|uniref:SDR family oxidoreductase n=1 Tax=Massilia sp. 9096 TaxID=1500894 RepID=UPI00055E3F90|nr:SDR family oxidoreductase [Massilia sp. 9096]
MSVKLKKLNEQVIVLTGATSGIGLATARAAAEAGAKLVLAARDGDALDTLAHEMRQRGADVATVAADVGDPADVARIGKAAIDKFGRVDTWINDAGVSVFGKNEEVALEDMQRVMQTNLWGVVNGSLEAVRLLKAHGGGALINIGSEASDRSIPLQGTYSASKHAVKAFTESLRMEVEKDEAAISVTLIKPAGIDTPFAQHAKNYMKQEPTLPPPVYAPELVAKTILYAAENPERDLFVGGRAKAVSMGAQLMPRVLDKLMNATVFRQQQSDKPSSPNRRDALHDPVPEQELRQRGNLSPNPAETNLYTSLQFHSGATKTVLLGGALLAAAWAFTRKPGRKVWPA